MDKFYKNKLMQEVLVENYKTFSLTLDTQDFIPAKYCKKIHKYLFKDLKKGIKLSDKETRLYIKQERRKIRKKRKQKREKELKVKFATIKSKFFAKRKKINEKTELPQKKEKKNLHKQDATTLAKGKQVEKVVKPKTDRKKSESKVWHS